MQAYDNFLTLLAADEKLFDDLLSVFDRETESLKKLEFQHLEGFSQQKTDISRQLEHNHSMRLQLLKQFSHSDNIQELVSAFSKQLTPQQQQNIEQRNQQLEAKLSQCRHQNMVNGQVITTKIANTQQVQTILTGSNNLSNTYNATGQIKSGSSSNRHQEI